MPDLRASFADAAAYLVDVAARVPADAWHRPGLGVWTVRDLVGHASRALTTVTNYLASPAERVDLATAVDYFHAAISGPERDAEIARQGRESAAALGDDPVASLRALADRAVATVRAAPDGVVVGTPFGGIRLTDYLPTRILELTVHGLDVTRAIGIDLEPPASAATVTLRLVADLAANPRPGRTLAGPLLLAATGRGPLPPGFTVL